MLINIRRQTYQPYLDNDTLPAHVFVKSIYNITRERNWRPLYSGVLANIEFKWATGKMDAGYHPNNPIHEYGFSFLNMFVLLIAS